MTQHLTSLKRSPDKDGDTEVPSEDFFPLSLHLGEEEITKLGMSGKNIGDEMMLLAKVHVTSISASERPSGRKFESMTLNLIEGIVETPKKDQASILFGKKDD